MRCYFATPRYDHPRSVAMGYAAGLRNVLLSYANVEEPRNAFAFWLNEPTNDDNDSMKLYFAGTAGATATFEQDAADLRDGMRARLISFADAQSAYKGHDVPAKFWIENRDELMKLYVAGNGKSPGSAQRDHDTGARNRLLSYAFLDDWAKDEFVFWIDGKPPAVSVFLDSGAFSAHTLGRKIDLGAYCDYVQRHQAALAAYAVLDVIGDVKGTLANLEAMRARGLDPVPVFHVDRERLDLLEDYLRTLQPSRYIALGGMASERPTRDELQQKLDPCWRVIQKHWPVRVHGLGVMAQWALERYPFYSVDSSSAIVAAGMGRVIRFLRGTLVADGWRDDVKRRMDGLVADGIGRVASAEGKSKSAHEGRRIRNIQAQLALEQYVTDLWTARGITWAA